MTTRNLQALALVATTLLAFSAPSYAETVAANPTPTISAPAAEAPESASASSVVKNFYAQLVETMKQGEKLGFDGRFKKLQPAVQAAFDLPTMTRLAVGLVWTKATPEEQKQLIDGFTSFSTANYANNFTSFNGEQFDVTSERAFKDGVIVETKLTPKDHAVVALNYLMRKNDHGAWKIIDVFLDGSISELANRRSEFGAIAGREGIPALVNTLGTKSKANGPS